MDPRLGAWYFGDLAHTAATTEGKWGPTAGQRVRKDSREVSPKEARQGAAARIPLARGAARLMRIGGGQHTLSHTHTHPSPRSAILSLIPTQRSGCSGLPKVVGRGRRLGKQGRGPLADWLTDWITGLYWPCSNWAIIVRRPEMVAPRPSTPHPLTHPEPFGPQMAAMACVCWQVAISRYLSTICVNSSSKPLSTLSSKSKCLTSFMRSCL